MDAVADGRHDAAYALGATPGHHAAADSYAGYCFLNNAAIAAQAALLDRLGLVRPKRMRRDEQELPVPSLSA